jgi:hypothetical protein
MEHLSQFWVLYELNMSLALIVNSSGEFTSRCFAVSLFSSFLLNISVLMSYFTTDLSLIFLRHHPRGL